MILFEVSADSDFHERQVFYSRSIAISILSLVIVLKFRPHLCSSISSIISSTSSLMLSPSLSPFRQRRRKASTPFLPGAWPSSSGSEEPSKDDANNSVIETPEGKSDVPPKELGRTSPTLPHLDHVMKFHRRISDTLSPISHRQSAASAESLMVAGVTKSTTEPVTLTLPLCD